MNRNLLILLISSILFSGCKREARWDCFKSSGDTEEEVLLLDAFQMLEVNDDIEVVLIPDSVHMVRISAWENTIDQVEAEVSGNTLTLQNANRCNWVRKLSKHPKVYVHFKELTNLTQNGSGPIVTKDTIRTKIFDYNQWSGGANVELILKTEQCFARIHTGTGQLDAWGDTQNLYAYSSSNGFLNVQGIKSINTAVSNEGTGDISVYASELLEVNIISNGNVKYYGSPPIVNSKISGRGELIAL